MKFRYILIRQLSVFLVKFPCIDSLIKEVEKIKKLAFVILKWSAYYKVSKRWWK